VVVDQVNTIPFFTPLWSTIPVVMFIHQLAREVWWYESSFPLNVLGFAAENVYLRCYKHVPVMTVSASTKSDLTQLGLQGPIRIIPEGIESIKSVPVSRPRQPSFLYVGRLAPSKRVADIIVAFALFCKSHPEARLSLVGDGPANYLKELRKLAHRIDVDDRVRFLGRISALEKNNEMARAHALLLASVREGWGLVVTEANTFGTPAVAYNVPGLRDSIRDQETGLLVEQTPRALAAAMLRLWHDPDLYSRLAKAAMAWSREFSFETTTDSFRNGLTAAMTSQHPRELPIAPGSGH
jgi:glycosyltransferase involved in cell wall biosynthesis